MDVFNLKYYPQPRVLGE